MTTVTQIIQKVDDLAVRIAAEIDALRGEIGTGGGGGSGGVVAWNDITAKPDTFAPSAHTHIASEITDIETYVDGRIALVPPGTPDWDDITGKPSTFAPSTHAHATGDVTGLEAYVDARIALAGSGTGNVFGPATSTVGNIVLFDNTGGTLLADAGAGFSANGLSLVGMTYANMKAALDLEIGTDVQAYSAKLGAVAALTWAADKLPYFTGSGAVATTDFSTFARTLLDDADAASMRFTLGLYETFPVAISDETTSLTTGAAKVTFRAPYACVNVAIPRASLNTSSSSGNPTFDVNINGTTMLSTKLSIDSGEETSVTATTAAVMSETAWSDDDEITIDIDTAGTGAKGGKIVFYLRRTS